MISERKNKDDDGDGQMKWIMYVLCMYVFFGTIKIFRGQNPTEQYVVKQSSWLIKIKSSIIFLLAALFTYSSQLWTETKKKIISKPKSKIKKSSKVQGVLIE